MDMSHLTTFLDSLVSEHSIPGLDCKVLKNGKEIYRHSAGYADVKAGKKITDDTLYFLYSASKVITCAAALQLYEKGCFLLYDSIGDYLPEFREMKKEVRTPDGRIELVRAEKPISIGDLFSMTAGISYDLASPSIQKVINADPDGYTTEALVKAVAENPLLHEPGTTWTYGLCHDVMGRLIEVISGKSFGEYLRQNIFEPLGMKDTCFRLPEEKLPRLSKLYDYSYETDHAYETPLVNSFQHGNRFESGGAGIISSVDDYCRFASAMCNYGTSVDGVRILGKNTVNLMRTNRLDSVALRDFRASPQNLGFGYGLGVRTAVNPAEGGFNCSCGSFGWGGAAGVYIHIDPEAGIVIFYAQHRLNSFDQFIHPRLRNIVYSCL